jgi:hypothetical protein
MADGGKFVGLGLAFLAEMGANHWLNQPSPAAATDVSQFAEMGEPIYFSNCSEARAAGAAPVYSGSPGYASHLDRDSDGIGCE